VVFDIKALPTQDAKPGVKVLRRLLSDQDHFAALSTKSREAALSYVSDCKIVRFEEFLQTVSPPERFPLTISQLAPPHETTKLDLMLTIIPTVDRLNDLLQFSADLFEEEIARRIVGHFEKVLEGVVKDPDRPISHLPLLTDQVRNRRRVVDKVETS
jgi:hypothetical protein